MPKILFSNSLEVGHNKEVFCLVFKFQSPNGTIVESIYITVSPSGAKTLIELLTAEITQYQKEHGPVEAWKSKNNPNSNNDKENTEYRV